MKNKLFSILCLTPAAAFADLPLSIEDLLTDKGKLKLEASLGYVNSESRRAEPAAPVYIQTGSASFVPVPTGIQENGRNSDLIAATLGLRLRPDRPHRPLRQRQLCPARRTQLRRRNRPKQQKPQPQPFRYFARH